jgi:hypothetical protein
LVLEGWFQYNWRLDQGNSIKICKNDPKQGVVLQLKISEKMAMPVSLDVKTKSGKITRVKLPVEVWQKKKCGLSNTIRLKKLKYYTRSRPCFTG